MEEYLTSIAPENKKRKNKLILFLIPFAIVLLLIILYLLISRNSKTLLNLGISDRNSDKKDVNNSIFGKVKEAPTGLEDYTFFTSYTEDKDGNKVLAAITSTVSEIQGNVLYLERQNEPPLMVDTTSNFNFYTYQKDLSDVLEISDISKIKKGMTITVFFDYNSDNNKVVFRLIE